MADVLTRKAVSFIEESKSRPFFLYFATHDIHVPRVPHSRFAGKTDMGRRGDVIAELDWCVGQVLEALDRSGLSANTLVIFSSDNGPVVDDGYRDEAKERLGSHKPAGVFRGGKYSNFEGGTRVPMVVRWPGRVKPGVSDAMVSHTDFLSSVAALVGSVAPRNVDSVDLSAAIIGASKVGRETLVEQASVLSLRVGKWKYIPPSKGPAVNTNVGVETGNHPEPQLYDLAADPGERVNLAGDHSDRVRNMAAELAKLRGN